VEGDFRDAIVSDHLDPTKTTHPDTLTCLECGRTWQDAFERWRLYVTAAEPTELLLYCAHCASREFDD
jgi:hypothetical protein